MNPNFPPKNKITHEQLKITTIEEQRAEAIERLQKKLREGRSTMSNEAHKEALQSLMDLLSQELESLPEYNDPEMMRSHTIEDSTYESRVLKTQEKGEGNSL